MSGKRTVGTCGRCGGPVTVPLVFHSISPPTPSCDACGARPKQAHGPVMDMDRRVSRTAVPFVAAADHVLTPPRWVPYPPVRPSATPRTGAPRYSRPSGAPHADLSIGPHG